MNKPTWEPPEDIDKECIAICKAINSLYGIHTIESCCGHEQDRFAVFIRVYDLDCLAYFLGKIHKVGWVCEVYASESREAPTFYLRSQSKGEIAYREADLIGLYLNA